MRGQHVELLMNKTLYTFYASLLYDNGITKPERSSDSGLQTAEC